MNKRVIRVLSLVLLLSILFSSFPVIPAAYAATPSPTQYFVKAGVGTAGNGSRGNPYGTISEALQIIIDDHSNPDGYEIILLSNFSGANGITEPLVFDMAASVTIKSDGAAKFVIQAVGNGWYTGENAAGATNKNHSMIHADGGCTLTIENVELDANQKCRVMVTGTSSGYNNQIILNNATIKNGLLSSSAVGAGIRAMTKTVIIADKGTVFENNVTDTGSASGGGALHIGIESIAFLNNVTFKDNISHSGGAIYIMYGTVYCTDKTKFEGNSATQRGGAVHNPQTVS